jgi:hypothetical protein
MAFEHSSANYLKTAGDLISHIRKQLGSPGERKEWTEENLDALRTFSIKGEQMSWFPEKDTSKRSGLKGQFLWDYMGCTNDDVIIIAESEWLSSSGELKHDFEKLLYTRCPIKVMLCGRWNRDGRVIADELMIYAKECSTNFAPGEVFILFCVGWKEDGTIRNDQVFQWQVPGEVCRDDGRAFYFQDC